MKRLLLGSLILVVGALIWLLPDEHGDYPLAIEHLTSQVFRETVTPESLRDRYAAKSFTILLIPGHDRDYSGAIYGGLREADLTLALAAKLKADLERSGIGRVITTRDLVTGEYEPEFATYFAEEREEINSFRSQLRNKFASLLTTGEITPPDQIVHHNFAPAEVATRLYGINRWANDNGVDLTLHIHFNDYPGRRGAGKYNGFSIYIPERQLPNARASRDLALAVQRELGLIASISNFPGEVGSPIEDQELIAVGANGSRLSASFLVEYGYLAEAQFQNWVIREPILAELSRRTVRGLAQYLGTPMPLPDTTLLPHTWFGPMQIGIKGSREVLALQTALRRESLYPPAGKDLRQCPINGNFGPCVQATVFNFQRKYGLPRTGFVDMITLGQLNSRHSI
ncbi:MAG: N-acetylmuramoyl-L-alanine amidase [Patescibacteria group bacterium]